MGCGRALFWDIFHPGIFCSTCSLVVKAREIKYDVCRCHQTGGHVQEQDCHTEAAEMGEQWVNKNPTKSSKDKSTECGQGLSPLLSTCQTTAGCCIQF